MQPQITTLLTLAEGTSIITEGVWEQRFRYVDELRRMGADISVDGKVAVVEGTGKLTGAPVKACDLRAGAALIMPDWQHTVLPRSRTSTTSSAATPIWMPSAGDRSRYRQGFRAECAGKAAERSALNRITEK